MVATTALGEGDAFIYPVAVILPIFSLIVIVLISPALVQHYSNRNIGAVAVVAGVIIANSFNFLNALIWPNDNFATWYDGVGYCDVTVKLDIFLQTMFPAAVSCILRALAAVMDTENSSWNHTAAQRRRAYAIDLICCLGLPSLQMLFHYIVQPNRYYIYGIAGCQASQDGSWLAILLLVVPLLLWTVVDAYFAILIMVRLVRYRLTFRTILANSNTTKSRFLRLYLLCFVVVACLLPLEALTLYLNKFWQPLPYSWSSTHPTDGTWDVVIYVRSNGSLFWDRIVWLVGGYLVFFLFGLGTDAMKLYQSALLAIGFDRIFGCLRPANQPRCSSAAATISTFGSKAKLFFKRKESHATCTSSTAAASATDSITSPQTGFLENMQQRSNRLHSPSQQQETRKSKVTNSLSSLSSLFFKKQTSRQTPPYDDSCFLANVSGPGQHVLSTVTSEAFSPNALHSHLDLTSGDVLVQKEIRQASESAETLPAKQYSEGV